MGDEITCSIDGLDSEGGHVQLADLLDRLGHVLNLLSGIDRLVGEAGTPRLYYRIVQATHNRRLRFGLEPVVKQGVKVAPDYVERCRKKFFGEMKAIRANQPVSPDMDLDLLDQIRDIALGVGQDFKLAEIAHGQDRVEINDEFEKNIKPITGEGDISFGSLEGTLEAANLHGPTRRYWIYPRLGPQ